MMEFDPQPFFIKLNNPADIINGGAEVVNFSSLIIGNHFVKLQGYSYDDLAPINDSVYIVAGATYANAQNIKTMNCDLVRYLTKEEIDWLVTLAINTRKEEIKVKILANPDNEDLCEPVIP